MKTFLAVALDGESRHSFNPATPRGFDASQRPIENDTNRGRSDRGRALIGAAVCAAAMTAAASAHASDCIGAGAGAGGTCPAVTLTTLYLESGVTGTNGNVYIAVSGAMTPLGCSLNGGYVTLPKAAPTFSATYGTLLALQTTKAPFDLRVVQGDGGYCVVAYISLH